MSADRGADYRLATEQHYSPEQLADRWGMSPKSVFDMHRKTPGVLRVGKGKLRVIRIPESIANLGPQPVIGSWMEDLSHQRRVQNAAHIQRRRARIARAAGSFTREDWLWVLGKHGNRCAGCGQSDIQLTVDHIVPLCRGGNNFPDNLQPLCAACNSSKGRLTMYEWTQRKEGRA